MTNAAQYDYRTEHIAVPPPGYRVRTIVPGPYSDHEVRIAFPPGRRKKGSGKLISILHPSRENPDRCAAEPVRKQLLANPIALLSPALIDAITSGAGFAAGTGIYETVRKGIRDKNRRARRNPGTVEEASQLAEEFHGRPVQEIVEAQESHMAEGAYTVLGTALALWLDPVEGDPNSWPAPNIDFDDEKVKLVADPRSNKDRAQFYFAGGDQSISQTYLQEEGIPLDTDLVPLGLVYAIEYWDAKSFDTGNFGHRFGEETGEVPALYYDRKKRKLYLVGGAYDIAPVRDDINASPGIVN